MKSKASLVASLLAVSSLSALGADASANWNTHCAQCHGKDGRGDTKMGKQLQAMDLTDPKKQAAFSDADAVRVIKEGIKEGGKTKMKAFADKLSDEDVKALVAYTRSLKK